MRPLPSLLLGLSAAAAIFAVEPNPAASRPTADYVPDVAALATPASSELRELVERFVSDRRELERFYNVAGSPRRAQRLREFLTTWQTKLGTVAFDQLGVEGRIDATLLRTRLAHELRLLEREEARTKEMAALLPFADDIAQLQESRRLLEPVDARQSAATLERMRKSLEAARAGLEAALKPAKDMPDDAHAKPAPLTPTKVVAFRAANRTEDLRKSLEEWFKTFDSYDPSFSWWTRESCKQLATALEDYGKFLREKIVGIDPKSKDEPIIGDPIGRDGLLADLANEMIAYTPEELIAVAEREFAWVDAELKRAAREMGCGDDWKAAMEKPSRTTLSQAGSRRSSATWPSRPRGSCRKKTS
jgi:hypothetical protein